MASRRAAEDLIREGRVQVNGKTVRELGTKADPTRDRVTIDGRPVRPGRLRYLAFHKPVGMVCSMADPEGRASIGDVVREMREHVFPVGRLDWESSGLVLLTNDGDLAQRLTHPRYGVEKVYRVKVRGLPDDDAIARLRRGVRLVDGPTAPAEVVVEKRLDRKTRLRITVREGRNRLVRRMCEAIGTPVDRLSREAIGPLRLGRLRVGEVRELADGEVLALRRATRLEVAPPARGTRERGPVPARRARA
ncbi:MAG: pseudouridine synthase [Alphaproteobacteria bacterium]